MDPTSARRNICPITSRTGGAGARRRLPTPGGLRRNTVVSAAIYHRLRPTVGGSRWTRGGRSQRDWPPR
eukprot:2095147-Pyramimonas_sp.AAC.1